MNAHWRRGKEKEKEGETKILGLEWAVKIICHCWGACSSESTQGLTQRHAKWPALKSPSLSGLLPESVSSAGVRRRRGPALKKLYQGKTVKGSAHSVQVSGRVGENRNAEVPLPPAPHRQSKCTWTPSRTPFLWGVSAHCPFSWSAFLNVHTNSAPTRPLREL